MERWARKSQRLSVLKLLLLSHHRCDQSPLSKLIVLSLIVKYKMPSVVVVIFAFYAVNYFRISYITGNFTGWCCQPVMQHYVWSNLDWLMLLWHCLWHAHQHYDSVFEEHPVHENTSDGCWHGCLTGAKCRWLVYCPADTTATPSSLLQWNPEWYWLTWSSRTKGRKTVVVD